MPILCQELQFVVSEYDECVFILRDSRFPFPLYLVTYVDDVWIFCLDSDWANDIASKVTANVQIHFHLRISTVCQSVHMRPWMWNVVRKESTLVEVSSLIDTLLCRRIELDHHRAVHLRPRHIHRRGIDVIQSCHASRCVTLC